MFSIHRGRELGVASASRRFVPPSAKKQRLNSVLDRIKSKKFSQSAGVEVKIEKADAVEGSMYHPSLLWTRSRSRSSGRSKSPCRSRSPTTSVLNSSCSSYSFGSSAPSLDFGPVTPTICKDQKFDLPFLQEPGPLRVDTSDKDMWPKQSSLGSPKSPRIRKSADMSLTDWAWHDKSSAQKSLFSRKLWTAK